MRPRSVLRRGSVMRRGSVLRRGSVMRPRYAKLRRDLWAMRGRVAMMVVAIAIGLTGVGAMLVARAVVGREAAAAYVGTRPASATLDVDGGVDADLLRQVRQRPGVVDATARQTVSTRVRVGGEWRRMLLFVIAPDDPLRIARFAVESGSWPAPDDGLLVERAAVGVLSAGTGDLLQIAGADGSTSGIRISGTVYDPALAPAPQERTGYGYLTPTALARLGFPVVAEQLKIVVGDPATGTPNRDQTTVDSTAAAVAGWLTANGHPVHQISAPPYRHPHANQTNTITGLFLGCALACLVLAGVLVASTLGSMLAAQTRQIGVMKTVGATTGQLFGGYLTATAAIAASATLLALGPALLAGSGLTRLVAGLLNVDLVSQAVPVWVFVVVVAAGLGVPLLVALVPLSRAARLTVRAALDDHGTDARAGARRVDRWMTRLRGGNRTTILASRNLLRRRGRLALTLTLLAAGGALFTAGLSTASAWQAWVEQGLARRSYDAEIQLTAPTSAAVVTAALEHRDGIVAVEPIISLPATPATGDGRVEVQRTYPDGGHGAFKLTALPPDTTMIHFDLMDGRWLRPGDRDAVVLNQAAATRLGNPHAGTEVHLSAQGHVNRWQVVGIVAEVGGPATAYTATGALDAVTGAPGLATAVRISVRGDSPATVADAEHALVGAGIAVAGSTPTRELRTAIDQHVVIFIDTLIALAVLMATVGILGLASAMSIAVTERTREYGIMQAIGATPGTVRQLVLTEGLLTAAAGCLIAIAVGVPLSGYVGGLLGRLSFGLPLPLQVSYLGLGVWTVLAFAGAGTATLAAARRAARLTIRETLAHQ